MWECQYGDGGGFDSGGVVMVEVENLVNFGWSVMVGRFWLVGLVSQKVSQTLFFAQ